MAFSRLLVCPAYAACSLRIPSSFSRFLKSKTICVCPENVRSRVDRRSRIFSYEQDSRPTSSSRIIHYSKILKADELYVMDAVRALSDSNVIALPTDTLYGIAADARSDSAIGKIYQIKARDLAKPLAVCVADVEDIQRYATVDDLPSHLLESLLPGPVTLVLPRGQDSELHLDLNPGLSSIGIRIPDQGFIRSVARKFGGALALTSANYSGEKSSLSVNEFQSIWDDIFIVFDGGNLKGDRAGSTIVDLTLKNHFSIIRNGSAYEMTYNKLVQFGLVERKF